VVKLTILDPKKTGPGTTIGGVTGYIKLKNMKTLEEVKQSLIDKLHEAIDALNLDSGNPYRIDYISKLTQSLSRVDESLLRSEQTVMIPYAQTNTTDVVDATDTVSEPCVEFGSRRELNLKFGEDIEGNPLVGAVDELRLQEVGDKPGLNIDRVIDGISDVDYCKVRRLFMEKYQLSEDTKLETIRTADFHEDCVCISLSETCNLGQAGQMVCFDISDAVKESFEFKVANDICGEPTEDQRKLPEWYSYTKLPDELRKFRSRIHGDGVFTVKDINVGHIFPVTHIDSGPFTPLQSTRTVFGDLLNHSANPNCRIVQTHKYGPVNIYEAISVRAIASGEELTVNYYDHKDICT